MSFKNLILRTSFVFLASFFVFNTVAQEIEEVVVTATKKEESLQDVALAVEALSSDDIAAQQIYDLSDIVESIPGMGSSKSVGSGSAYVIRGIGSFGVGAANTSSVVTASNAPEPIAIELIVFVAANPAPNPIKTFLSPLTKSLPVWYPKSVLWSVLLFNAIPASSPKAVFPEPPGFATKEPLLLIVSLVLPETVVAFADV